MLDTGRLQRPTNVKENKMKRLALVSALVVLGLTGFTRSLEASTPSAAPDTGYVGACHMLNDAKMITSPTSPPFPAAQGIAGMYHAIFVSGGGNCSTTG
jgi:hypothetical protein